MTPDQVAQALEHLRRIDCSDPAAATALRAVRLTIHTLEHWWLERPEPQ